MSKVQTVNKDENRLVEIVTQGDSLLVRTLSAPYQARLTVVALMVCLVCILFAISYTVFRDRPVGFFLWILGVAVALLALRMFDIRRYSAKEDSFRFDLKRDTVEKNGEELAKTSEVEHLLVRRIRREDNEDLENSDYALVVALKNTKRFTVTESEGVPGARGQVLRAAEEVAEYLGVNVVEGERSPTEYWMDR